MRKNKYVLDKSVLDKSVLDKTLKYKEPCLITLSGLPGSGKTVCSKVLSKNLKIFIVSNDFLRGYYDENIDSKVESILNRKVLLLNFIRLFSLFINRVSVVLDSDANDKTKFKKLELLTKIFKYQIIKIKINSLDDSVNIDRIKNRDNENIYFLDSGIIGDNIKSFCYSEFGYNKIKSRKPQLLSDDFFDYVLNNDGNLQEYIENINNICENIISKKLTLK